MPVSTDDEAYTYNKRINRLAAVQEHRMIVRAVDRGVPAERIAEALGLDVVTIRRRFRMLDGICPDAVELLKDTACPLVVFEVLRQMAPIRQVEAAELMIGQNNFTMMFARALLAATPANQLIDPRKRKPTGRAAITSEQMARMERELASLESQVKSVEDSYGMRRASCGSGSPAAGPRAWDCSAAGRMVGIFGLSLVVLLATPTKWTMHFSALVPVGTALLVLAVHLYGRESAGPRRAGPGSPRPPSPAPRPRPSSCSWWARSPGPG